MLEKFKIILYLLLFVTPLLLFINENAMNDPKKRKNARLVIILLLFFLFEALYGNWIDALVMSF